VSRLDPDAILAGLNPEQRQAAQAVSGPVVILAGAGTGKTRVISHRVAYAVATGAVDERQVLVVSFTTKAAAEMVGRLRGLGLREATASTLHAAARRQLAHFWPLRRGRQLSAPSESKLPLLVPLARALPGHYRYTPARDLASEIEWAKNRRIGPDAYEREATRANRTPPLPIDLMGRLYRDYERAKARAGALDFEDLLEQAITLYTEDADAAALVRRRYAWFSVDEYQDTNPLQQAMLDAWLGDRRDIAVVGDPNQTIYSFTGATPEFLLQFGRRYPDATTVSLVRNYRSSPQILALANRLVSSGGPRLVAEKPAGPEPRVLACVDGAEEVRRVVDGIRTHLAELEPTQIAVLSRTSYGLEAIAEALRVAGIAFRFAGPPFYRSEPVRAAIRALGTSPEPVADLAATASERWQRIGFRPDEEAEGEAAERQAAFATLLAITERFGAEHPGASVRDLVAEFGRLAAVEADEDAAGVTLSTIHAAKGAEWEGVFVLGLEDGNLPISHAIKAGADEVAEEQRLLYVALTRAARHLTVTWAAERTTPRGRTARQKPSRFVRLLRPPVPPRTATPRSSAPRPSPAFATGDRVHHRRHGAGTVRSVSGTYAAVGFDRGTQGSVALADLILLGNSPRRQARLDDAGPSTDLFSRLVEWRRERARRDGVPAYVVAHDAHLRAVAAARPTSLASLGRLPGMGPIKVERYGEEILASLSGSGND
jgi:DNA helicase-2/ATP-dependent DNA helicase PcrA